jgi:hypothetical protein
MSIYSSFCSEEKIEFEFKPDPCAFFNMNTRKKDILSEPLECWGNRKPVETVQAPDYGWMFSPFQPGAASEEQVKCALKTIPQCPK